MTTHLVALVDGVLVEKAMGFYESNLACILIQLLRNFVAPGKLGTVTGAGGAAERQPSPTPKGLPSRGMSCATTQAAKTAATSSSGGTTASGCRSSQPVSIAASRNSSLAASSI